MAIKAPIAGGLCLPSPSPSPLRAAASARTVVGCPPLRSSFFSGGVGALKVVHMQTSRFNRHKCGAQMNLFSRLARVVSSYANALLSSMEDPEKILEQAVLEMNDDLTKMRQATAQVLASQKRLENKYKAAEQASKDWYQRAQLALGKGEEDLAREALKRRKSYADNASTLKSQLDQQKAVVENLVSNTKLLERKIQEARSKKDTLKARAQSAKTATRVNEVLGNVNTSGALSAFEKMEDKVMAMESEAQALNQLTVDDLEGKFAMLESSSVDDDLANLKKELSGSTPLSALKRRRKNKINQLSLPSELADLSSVPSHEDIKKVVFSMGSFKSPGHDGLNAQFHKSEWNTIAADLCCFIQNFFITNVMPPNINHTLIALIPKKAQLLLKTTDQSVFALFCIK